MKIQTEALYFPADVQFLLSIEQKVSKLKEFFNRILEAYITLKLDNVGLKKKRVVEVTIHIPNGVIFIKESCKTFEAALGKAFVAIRLQLLRYKTKRFA